MKLHSRFLFPMAAAALLAGCSKTPVPEKVEQKAPDVFRVKFETSKGNFVVQVNKEWAPLGAQRFFDLVQSRYFTGARFFRVIRGFMVQFGINADPKVSAIWREARIPDDPVKQSNRRGRITFAKLSAPHTRTTQVFINFGDNGRLDKDGFAPFGEVVSAMEVVDSLYAGYGEGQPRGNGPSQDQIQIQGNAYLEKDYPRLDYIKKATVE